MQNSEKETGFSQEPSAPLVPLIVGSFENIIPIGDHCAISIILKELGLRTKSYPFDWVTNVEQLYETNILYNINIINQLVSQAIENIVNDYIGDALINDSKINSINKIWFPHENGNIIDIYNKYIRRFNRLKSDLYSKNVYLLVTRIYYIGEADFNHIVNTLLSFNKESIIIFISGTEHTYLNNNSNPHVIFKHIYYDVGKFYGYDYDEFRPNIKNYISTLLQPKSIFF